MHKGLFKRMQYVGTTLCNTFGHNMLSLFKHHVRAYWAMLDRVERCCMKFDFCEAFHPTSANVFIQACPLVDIHWYLVNLFSFSPQTKTWALLMIQHVGWW